MAHSPRTIQPGDVQDERVARLPLAAAYTWAYLPTVLDDEGRAVDNPAVVNGRLWPLRFDEHPTAAMATDLEALAAEGLICRYVVDGQSYLHDPVWKRRQRLARAARSALPRCPVHDSGLREFVGDTLTSVSDQVGSFLGGAAAGAGTTRVRDTVARLVEDVTFPVDPETAAAYGQRIRDFLSGAVAPGHPDGDDEPAARFPAAGTVSGAGPDAGPDVAADAGPGAGPGVGPDVATDAGPGVAAEPADEVEYDIHGAVADLERDDDAVPTGKLEGDDAVTAGEGEPDPSGGEHRPAAPGEVWRAVTDDPADDPAPRPGDPAAGPDDPGPGDDR